MGRDASCLQERLIKELLPTLWNVQLHSPFDPQPMRKKEEKFSVLFLILLNHGVSAPPKLSENLFQAHPVMHVGSTDPDSTCLGGVPKRGYACKTG